MAPSGLQAIDALPPIGSGNDRTSRPVSASRIRQTWFFCSPYEDRDLGPIGTEGQDPLAARHAPATDGPTGRQVVHDESLRIVDQHAIRRLSGLNLADADDSRRGSFRDDCAPLDVPDRQGTDRENAWSPGSGRRG